MPECFLESALAYAELGYRVFPCAPDKKTPLTDHGFQDATSDVEQIERWWSQCPDANIAIPTEGLLVVDIDGTNNAWLKDEPEKLLELAAAPISLTPRGGRHYIFRQPEGKHWRNSTGKLAKKVDTRADGGYIVVPPSILAVEGAYRWAEGMSLDVSPDQLPDPPSWLVKTLDNLATSGQGFAPVGPVSAVGNPIPSGQRNSTLASLAGTMRRAGMGEPEILAAIRATNSMRCNPPLSDKEVEKITASICRYEPDQISVALAENHWAQMCEEERELPEGPMDPGAFPEHLLNVPGFIGEIIAYNLATAFKKQPVLALAGAIALQGTLVGRKVRDEVNTRTNIYCLGTCATGDGKERAREINKEILYLAGLAKLAGPEGLASHAGLINATDLQPAILFQLDEIGRLLKTLGEASRSPHLYHIATMLMKLYTSSSSIYIGDAYADTKQNKCIDQPNVSIYGTSVPQSFYEGLNYESISDGFLSRMLVFEGAAKVRKKRPQTLKIPKSIIDVARWWGDYRPGGNLAKEHPEPVIIPSTAEAERIYDELDCHADNESERLGEPLGALWTRTVEKARKLGIIYACSANHQSPLIDVDAVKWACDLSTYLTQRMIYLANQWVAESPFDAKRKKILRIISKEGADGMTKSQLYDRTRGLTNRERTEIIDSLLTCGDIRELPNEFKGKKGKPRVGFVATIHAKRN
jgi:hypothetical protein